MDAEKQISVFSTLALSLLEISAERQVGPIQFLRRVIRDEISYISFKIFVGLILACTIVYSIFNVGDAFQVFAGKFENGYVIELAGFGTLVLLSSAAMYFLFQDSIRRSVFQKTKSAGLPLIDFELIALKFAQGFLEGLDPKVQEGQPKQHGLTVTSEAAEVSKLQFDSQMNISPARPGQHDVDPSLKKIPINF